MADIDDGGAHFLKAFDDPVAVARYAEGPPRFVPGLDALHRMTELLLAEAAPEDARVLVLGAGGGVELDVLSAAQPGWSFVGVDPAREMLRLAERRLGPRMERVELLQGYIDDAPDGPFDAAVCLLTLHFLGTSDRERTLRQIHRRLSMGAPFVAAHASVPQEAELRGTWLDRYAAFAISSGAGPEQARTARDAVSRSLNLLSPQEDEAILRAAGFADASLFFAAFTWRGWIGHAGATRS